MIDELKSASNRQFPLRSGEDMIARNGLPPRPVKANDPLRYLELEKLIQDLPRMRFAVLLLHGRPTMIQISLAELKKKFGRKGVETLRS